MFGDQKFSLRKLVGLDKKSTPGNAPSSPQPGHGPVRAAGPRPPAQQPQMARSGPAVSRATVGRGPAVPSPAVGQRKGLFSRLWSALWEDSSQHDAVLDQPAVPVAQMPAQAAQLQAVPSDPSRITLPLQCIVDTMPEHLKALARFKGPEMVSFDSESLIPQLSSGSVRVTFGELRAKARPGCFQNNPQHDEEVVELPLQEVVARVSQLLPSRRPKKRLEVPDDIGDTFSVPNAPRSSGTTAPQPRPSQAQPPRNAPQPPSAPAPFKKPSQPAPVSAQRPAPQPAPAPAPLKMPSKPTPAPAPAKPAPQPAPAAIKMPSHPMPVPAAPKAASQPVASPTLKMPTQPAVTPPAPKPVSQPVAPSAPLKLQPQPPQTSENALTLNIAEVSAEWPEPIMREITNAQLANGSVSIPIDRLEPGLRAGRITFIWGELCQWIQPRALSSTAENESTDLELPLQIIAPLFMAQKRSTQARKKVALDQSIPNVFATGSQQQKATPAPAQTPPPAPAVAAAPLTMAAQAATGSTTVVAHKPAPAVAPKPAAPAAAVDPDEALVRDILKKLESTEWSPQEVTTQAARMRGIAGLLIGTPDGFVVASEMPAHLQGDVMAALFPQLFGKLNEYFKDLELGQMSNLRFTVGNSTFCVFNAGELFLGAVARSGEKLPEAGLERIARALAQRSV